MVRELDRVPETSEFPETAPAANPVFFRTYSRLTERGRETWDEVCFRTIRGLTKLGKLTPEEAELVNRMQHQLKALASGRWLWVGGTEWVEKPENFSGAYNCTSTNAVDWQAFGLMMDLAMMGCGTGAVIEPKYINHLPQIRNRLIVTVDREIGTTPADLRREGTEVNIENAKVSIHVGDSRQGWVKSYLTLLELSSDERFSGEVEVFINLRDVRASGETLKGFGGVANPVKLPELYERCAAILNRAIGRQLNAVECCLLVDEAAVTIVAGNIRRCLPKGALVHTSQGLVRIEEIQPGVEVETPQGMRKVLKNFDQGRQQVYRVNTNANPLFATEEHRVAVMSDTRGSLIWKKVKHLDSGDRLMHTTKMLPGTNQLLPKIQFSTSQANSSNPLEITIPILDTAVAWLIGFTHGNGSAAIGRNHQGLPDGFVSWSLHSKSSHRVLIESKIAEGLSRFGLKSSSAHIKGENTILVRADSIQLAEYITEYIKQPKTPITIPDWILTATPESRAAYLAGLMDSDGAINRPSVVVAASIYPDFLRQVAALYASLGIATRLHLQQKGIARRLDLWHLTLPAFKTEYNAIVAPHSAKGMAKVGMRWHGFTIPSQLMRQDNSDSESRQYRFPANIGVDTNYESFRERAGVGEQIPVTVLDVQPWKEMETFDLEVEDQHCFFVEGLLVHNSAGMRQFDSHDQLAANAKSNLWQQDENGNWSIDPERDALRMANHSRVFHHKPTLEECIEAVRQQYYSGEGAIQWAGEAVARANIDLLATQPLKAEFLAAYSQGKAKKWLQESFPQMPVDELEHRLARYALNPCGEILGSNFHCNLSEIHINQIDPRNYKEQEEAFTAGALSVAGLLHHKFVEERYRKSRELDPIVGVSFTGLFDFFVAAFGVDWLRWWATGRPETAQGLEFKRQEQEYLTHWREIVHRVVWDYCDRHQIKRPNRCTTVQPSGTKSLLTGASPGWHPPKAQRFLRRITFRKNDPVALACIDYGYNVVPSQSDKDENGSLLNDPFDPRCSEWLVEIPVAVAWADLPGADEIDISQFSAIAQMDFYMQVQQYYVRHNTSATIELRENEIEALGTRIYEAIKGDEGYISAALLSRFDAHQTFPRLPFEPITEEQYKQLMKEALWRRQTEDFHTALSRYDLGELAESGPSGCDSDQCLFPLPQPE